MRRHKQFNVMPSNKFLYQTTITAHRRLEIAIASPLLVIINEPLAVKLNGRGESIQMRVFADTYSFLPHPRKQNDQSWVMIHLLMTPHERKFCLFTNSSKVKGAETAPVVLKYGPSSTSCVITTFWEGLALATHSYRAAFREAGQHQNISGTTRSIRTLRTAVVSWQVHHAEDGDRAPYFNVLGHHCRTTDVTDYCSWPESEKYSAHDLNMTSQEQKWVRVRE